MILIIGHSAGGTYDTYAHLIAADLPKFLPGHPQVIVQNMPGAKPLRATSYIYRIASQDCTAIGAVASNIAFKPLLKSSDALYGPLSEINTVAFDKTGKGNRLDV